MHSQFVEQEWHQICAHSIYFEQIKELVSGQQIGKSHSMNHFEYLIESKFEN
jgi:hypothetical protein